MVNDIIVQIGGARVQTTDALINRLANCEGQTTVVFLNSENGQLESTQVNVQNGRLGVTAQQVEVP